MLRALLSAFVVSLAVTSCSSTAPDGDAPDPSALTAEWQEVGLPQPAGAPGRIAVRAATRCDDQWYVVGGIFTPGGTSSPAAWRSSDGVSWTSMDIRARGYWAQRGVLSSVACRDEQVAMLGAKEGGAHGNPRVSTFYARPDGAMVDVIAPFERYGGPEGVNVGVLAAGPDGWLIVGNRIGGAAIWGSSDATDFALVDDDAELGSDEELTTFAIGQVHDGNGWTVVGSASREGRISRVPMAWTSTDGVAWQRQEVPETKDFNDLEQVIAHRGGLMAVGVRGESFGVWRRDETGTWEVAEQFGTLDPDRVGSPAVSGLARAGSDVLATTADGTSYQLWVSRAEQPWRPVITPTRPGIGSERRMTTYADGGTVLLVTDDGRQGRVWLSDSSTWR